MTLQAHSVCIIHRMHVYQSIPQEKKEIKVGGKKTKVNDRGEKRERERERS